MRKQLTIILVLLNLLVLAVFYLFEQRSGVRPQQLTKKVFGEEAVDIDYIRISGKNLEADRALKKEENRWVLTSPIEWPANFFAVSRILNQIIFLEKETSFLVAEIEAAGRDLASYGLADPQLRVEFGKGIARTAISIGASTKIGNRVYILSADQKEIMVIKRDLFDSLLVNLGNLQSQSIFDIPLFEVQTLSLQKSFPAPLRVRIARIDEGWRFEIPFQTRADKAGVDTLINGLNNLNAQSFIGNPDTDLNIYGLANPSMRLTLEGEDKRQTILLGDKIEAEEGDQAYYAKGSEKDTIFTIPTLLFDERLVNAQEVLRERRFVRFDAKALSTIEIIQSDRSVSLQKLETGDWQVLRRNKDGRMMASQADPKIVAEMMVTLATLRAQNFVSDAPSNADLENYGFTNPQRKVQLKGGMPVTLIIGDLVDGNSRHVYAKTEREPFIYEVDNSILDDFHARPLKYNLRIPHREPGNAKLVGISVWEAQSESIIYNAVLNEVTPDWESIAKADEPDEEGKESLLSLVKQATSIEAREFIDDTFDNVPWRYRLDLLFESTNNPETPAWTTRLWVTERLSGTNAIAGMEQDNKVFYATQEFTDAFFKLTFSRFDPGPEPEPKNSPQSLPPAPDQGTNKPKP